MKKTGRPLVLTVNGRAAWVVQDARSYAKMLGLMDRLEWTRSSFLEQTIEEEKEADELLGSIAEKVNVEIPQGRNGNAKRTASTSGRRSKSAA